jgi:hypothetical protein
MESQLDDDGYRIMIRPRPGREVGRHGDDREPDHQLAVTGTTVNWTGARGRRLEVMDKGTINPLAGILPGTGRPRAFLSDANDWYLFADPATCRRSRSAS